MMIYYPRLVGMEDLKMSDFTIEELRDLEFCVSDHDGYQDDSIHRNLLSKIQSLIDNYCEHEWSPAEALNVPLHCMKCGLKVE